MPLKTTAFDAAEARGWSLAELSRRSGLPIWTLYSLKSGHRSAGPKAIQGIMRAFPDLPYERLFMPADSAVAQKPTAVATPDDEPAAA